MPKLINDQNLFGWSQLWCWTAVQKNDDKRSSHSGDIQVERIKQSNWQRRFWGQYLRTRLFKITESICYFTTASYLNSVLTYYRFNIGNYFRHAQVSLTTSSLMNRLNHIDVFIYDTYKNHSHSKFVFEIWLNKFVTSMDP